MPVLRGLVVAILASLAIAGCGHGRRLSDPKPTEPATAVAPMTPQDELAALQEKARTATFKAVYQVSGLDEDGLAVSGTVTQVQRGTEMVRVDLEVSTASPETGAANYAMTIIRTPNVVALCAGEAGPFSLLLGSDHSCVAKDPNTIEDPLPDLVSGFGGLMLPESGVRIVALDVERRTIAGRETRCHRLKVETDEGWQVMCFSTEGILLYVRSEASADEQPGASSSEMEAVEVSETVDDRDFELPYPPVQPETLEVRNETDVPVFVDGHADNSDMTNGHIDLDPGASGVLRAGLFGEPAGIYLGTYEIPQWHWTCTWADAKANEPLVIRDQSANCRDTSPDHQPRPTPFVAPSSPGPGLAPFGVAITPLPGP